MTPTKPRTLKSASQWAMLVRTPKGQVYRFYRNRSLQQAIQQAENRADCLEVMRAIEITPEQYETGLKNSDQQKPFKSAAPAVWRNQTSSARD